MDKTSYIIHQSRWTSWYLWAAIVAQILTIIQLSGLGIDIVWLGNLIAGVLQLLVILGILNNPSDSRKF